jgi:hypothetical protein
VTLPSGLRDWQLDLLVRHFNSGTREGLACRARYIHVSPHVLGLLDYSTVTLRF